jgi:hypothetical protein
VYHELSVSDPESDSSRAWSRAEVEDFFRRLSPQFAKIPVAPTDKLWLDTKAFLEGGNAPLASQGAIKALVGALVDWARHGLPVIEGDDAIPVGTVKLDSDDQSLRLN